MNRPRITIGGLAALVAGLALVFAAWKDASTASMIAVLIGSIVALQLATALAVVATGPARRFWLGFALLGLPYLVAGHVPEIRDRLPTQPLVLALVRIGEPALDEVGINTNSRLSVLASPSTWPGFQTLHWIQFVSEDNSMTRQSIGHSALTIVVGVAGGLAFLILPPLYRRLRAREAARRARRPAAGPAVSEGRP